MGKIIHFFDKLEDKIRGHLSRYPIVYALIGGVGIVLFWKGVWETAEYFQFLYGPGSIIASLIILLSIGLFVSYFIGDSIIISGLKQEKKLIDKEESEILAEDEKIGEIKREIGAIHRELHKLSETSMKVVQVPVEEEKPREKTSAKPRKKRARQA